MSGVYPYLLKLFWQFTLTYWGMLAKVWACAERDSVIYHSLPRHARRCIHTNQNSFGNWLWPTEACQQGYGHVPKVVWWLTVPYWGMLGGISIPTKIVLEFYPDLPSHSAKVWSCAKGVSVIYHWILRHAGKGMDMCQKCFSQLPLPTETCQEVYPCPPKLFWKFTLTYQGMPTRVWACTKSVSVMYHSLPRHGRRRIHAHRNFFGNLWWPATASWQKYGHVPKVFW